MDRNNLIGVSMKFVNKSKTISFDDEGIYTVWDEASLMVCITP